MKNLKNKKFLIAGSSGQLARAFIDYFEHNGFSYEAPDESVFDITDPDRARAVIQGNSPDYLINCAAYNQVDRAEDDPQKALTINAEAPGLLADVCQENGVFLVHYSSDYVFDGKKGAPYAEDDTPNPLNVYGTSKLKGEQAVQDKMTDYLIFRLSWVIGQGTQNFLYKLAGWAKNNPVLKISEDEISVPTFTPDIVWLTLLSLEDGLTGLYHLVSSGYASRYELSEYYMQLMGLNNTLERVSIKSFDTKAERPLFSAMSNARLAKDLDVEIPSWKESMTRFLKGRENE